MAGDRLERALRDSLSRQVADPVRLAADPAGLAIRRGRHIQRRRAMAGLALAAVATAGVSAGVAQISGGPGRHPGQIVVIGDPDSAPRPADPTSPPLLVLPSGADERPPVDLVLGTVLHSREGDRIDLTPVGAVERVQRISGGWLVVGAPAADGRTLWFVDGEHPPQVVLAGVEAVALATDGRQVAWRDGTELFAAGIIAGKALATVRTPLPSRAAPVGFVGDAVVVRLDAPGGGYALWRPGQGDFDPAWNTETATVYGVLPDGRVVGQVVTGPTRRPCLALLDPARKLAPLRTACTLTLTRGGVGQVSPDGRWLVANGQRAGDPAMVALLVDLNRAFDGASAPPAAAGPPLTAPGRWSEPATLTHADRNGTLVRIAAPAVAAGGTVDRTTLRSDGSLLVVGGVDGPTTR
ncbi:hypothetical protein [Micromonospora echinofusca]|uniref:PQQ-like domain-containing protein n=1 Tax=Micromonospora echinofusca TaxID=47858 RepID=A0ABS3VS78_MICEH|nr:hypothetical protein [Micromonospora echinofusca]MBO4207385.1 hypothetical protein [Micromonospora echinofusca]